MVSLITEGSATDPSGRPFIRRRPETWLIFVLVLALICAIVWFKAFLTQDTSHTAMACNSPSPATDTKSPQPAPLGQRVGQSRLKDVDPAPLLQSKVRVLNANNKSGQATHIASLLGDLGFASAPGVQIGNDPVYVNGDLNCTGQIRFGVNGRPAAASVQLVAPCAELIEDQRQDDTVDLVLGSVFGESLRPNADAEEVLRSLKNPAPGGSPAIDSKLLAAARQARC
ncbi:envelope integrity protein Cei [Nocardia arthritidis]|uniref:envelope integrity protein Cei n=1 Tax=Nocardia arthritidis TaxID=228602 RepID=UPI00142DE2E6|nr:envelope integrity protein Cei [Nocardia arthritidis]